MSVRDVLSAVVRGERRAGVEGDFYVDPNPDERENTTCGAFRRLFTRGWLAE